MAVDGHVHIHPCFDVAALLEFALTNFQQNFSESSPGSSQPFATSNSGSKVAFLLALSESQGQNAFAHLRSHNQSQNKLFLKNWQISSTRESESLRACPTDRTNRTDSQSFEPIESIYILAGRQIVTSEGLEVLALATDCAFIEGRSTADTIQAVLSKGGIPVIPWGFGKWLGKRGQWLSALLRSPHPNLCLADSGSRPVFWPEPALLQQASAQGLSVLSGTDPFPFRSETKLVGRSGFTITGAFDPSRPAASLRQALSGAASPTRYGSQETPFRCLRNQLAMQFIKRFRSQA